ncbi:MAG TPA: hypothetical protein VIF34_05590 [Methylocystis sp.]|jgi:hypothetical protein
MTTQGKSDDDDAVSEVRLTRRRRVPIAGYYRDPEGVPEWKLDTHQWRNLEIAYDCAIGNELRDEIAKLVNDYFYFDQIEKNSVLSKDALAYLSSFKKQATAFVEMLLDNAPDTAALNTRDTLRNYYWIDPEAPEDDNFAKLAEKVRSLIDAASALANDLNEGRDTKRKERPSAWDRMIVDLSAAVARFGLPETVNKGTDKTVVDDPSPFVRLVMALQSTFPADRRRFHFGLDGAPSYAAAAGAVSKAQSAFRNHIETRDAKSPTE